MGAAYKLVKKFNPKAIYISFNIEIEGLPGRDTLPEGVEVTSVLKV